VPQNSGWKHVVIHTSSVKDVSWVDKLQQAPSYPSPPERVYDPEFGWWFAPFEPSP
jgi:hypothetical protein